MLSVSPKFFVFERMFRFRLNFNGIQQSLQFGVPQATALAIGYDCRCIFFVSENRIYSSQVFI